MNRSFTFQPVCRTCTLLWRQRISIIKHYRAKHNIQRQFTILSDFKPLLQPATTNIFYSRKFYNKDIEEFDKPEIKIKEDGDVFGEIAKEHNVEVFKFQQEFAEDNNEPAPRRSRRNTPYWFHLQCRKLARQKKVFECVEMLEVRMLKEERVDPEEWNFSVVIGALSKIGHTEKAFGLYKKLKEYGLEPSPSCYTALFNCVANSNSSKDFIRAKALRKKLQENKILLNRMSYNAMIKAYAKHGTLKETFEVFRDSIAAGGEPDSYTFSFLLMSCRKDRETGFLHAIQVWRNMVLMGVKPRGKFLTDFLGVMYKCGLGNSEQATRLLLSENSDMKKYEDFLSTHVRQFRWLKGQESLPNPNKLVEEKPTEPLKLEGFDVKEIDDTSTEKVSQFENTSETATSNSTTSKTNKSEVVTKNTPVPNLLLPIQNLNKSGIVSIGDCSKPSHRLQLIGGVDGILKLMKKNKIPASIRIYSILAKSLPPSFEEENKLMLVAEKLKSELDTDFYNCIMHRRCLRRKFEEAREILERMESKNLTPNYRTWCIYALTCTTYSEGKRFLKTLAEKQVVPDVIIFHTLVNAALRSEANFYSQGVMYPDYFYLSYLIDELKARNITANERLVSILETAAAWPKGYNRWKKYDEKIEKRLNTFRKNYSTWLKETHVKKEIGQLDKLYQPVDLKKETTSIQSQSFLND